MTSMGVILRKLRLDKQELLKDMAANLHVSSAFLSAVENGKKKPPANFIDKICSAYNLSESEREALVQAADMSVQEIKVNLGNATPAQHQVALSFAKALNGLTDDQVQQIMNVFEKRKK